MGKEKKSFHFSLFFVFFCFRSVFVCHLWIGRSKEVRLDQILCSMETFAIIYCLLIDALKMYEHARTHLRLRDPSGQLKKNDQYTLRKKRKKNYTKKKTNISTRDQSQFRINSTKIYIANQLTDLRNECSTLTFGSIVTNFFFWFLFIRFIGIFHVFMCIALCARKASNSVKTGRNLNNK